MTRIRGEAADPSHSPVFQRALEAARSEQPTDELAERVLARLHYRQLLEEELRSASLRRMVTRLATAAIGGSLAAAAAVAFWMRGPRPPADEIRAESNAASSPSAVSSTAAGAATSVVDPCARGLAADGTSPLIDDFEDGDDAVAPIEHRSGLWRWARETDAPGTAPALLPMPRPSPTSNSKLALHVKGARLFDWGASVAFTFSPPCYDASKYRGIAFQARGPGRLYVAPRESGVIPVDEGGTCVLDRRDCHNPHAAKVDLDRSFRAYEILWTEMRQRGIGAPPLDPARLNSLAFLIRPEDTPYDVWIDDVRFVR